MLDTGWNHHRTSVAKVVMLAVQHHLTLPGLDPNELIDIIVRFNSDVLAWLQRHQDELRVWTGEEHAPEFFVLQRVLLDVCDIAVHELLRDHVMPENGDPSSIRLDFVLDLCTSRITVYASCLLSLSCMYRSSIYFRT